MDDSPPRNLLRRVIPGLSLPRILTLICSASVVVEWSTVRGEDVFLPGTELLTINMPLDAFMVSGINRYCLRALANSPKRRAKKWHYRFSSPEAYSKSLESNRQRFQRIIGVRQPRVTSQSDQQFEFELLATLSHSSVVARTDDVAIHAVRWRVLDGVTQEGLLLQPQTVRACVVAIPDADWTPEMFCGLIETLPAQAQIARRLAAAGCLVVVPTLISRSDKFSGSRGVGYTNLTHREFLYRQAFEVGRHIIGFDKFKRFSPRLIFLKISITAGLG